MLLLLLLTDMSELPLCEVSLACDNLLCDAHGRQPNPTLVVHVYMPTARLWVQYARTEIIEVSLVLLQCIVTPLIQM